MQFVVIKDMSAGNETVGDMWKETRIFEEDATLLDVLKWAGTKKQVTITLSDNFSEEWAKRKPKEVMF